MGYLSEYRKPRQCTTPRFTRWLNLEPAQNETYTLERLTMFSPSGMSPNQNGQPPVFSQCRWAVTIYWKKRTTTTTTNNGWHARSSWGHRGMASPPLMINTSTHAANKTNNSENLALTKTISQQCRSSPQLRQTIITNNKKGRPY